MPRRIPYQLQWSTSTQKYAVFYDGKQVVPAIEPASKCWFNWLETIASFSFESRSGVSCTARKEAVQRGGTYWYAYRRQSGRMVKRYLARTADLTPARLEEVTTILNDGPAFSGPDQTEEEPVETLLLSRLQLPRLPMQYISRPRLLELLQQGMQRQLTLVAAPAGSGKTTLLAAWATNADFPVAWISLETADNDPSRFLVYLMAALTSLGQHIGPIQQPASAQKPEHALTSILNDLSNVLQQEAVIILDDYHLLNTNAVHAQIRFLLDHLPTHLHLMIGTRVDPPLPLARLRMQHQLDEIRAEDLRFGPDEVEALTSTMGLALSQEAVNLLEQHTEGWIAGVQLLTLALRGQTDVAAFLQTFHGTHRFFLDYVSEEVLAQQTLEAQRFLLYTSILTRMTGPLCDAVTGLVGGQDQLADLLRANLFVSALDDIEIWYRYHPLFAETLRTRLQKLEPDIMPELYLRASRWYEQQQSMEEAIVSSQLNQHLLAGSMAGTTCFPS